MSFSEQLKLFVENIDLFGETLLEMFMQELCGACPCEFCRVGFVVKSVCMPESRDPRLRRETLLPACLVL